MRRVTGYVDGKPQWSENEPAAARVQGVGGAALGWFSGTTLSVGPSVAVRRETQARRKAEREERRDAEVTT